MINVDWTSRKKQLGFFNGTYIIKQDQELIDLIAANNYTQALGVGAVGYFSNYITLVDHGKVDFCIYIQDGKTPFDFNNLIDHVNTIVKENMNTNGSIYLSLNKYTVKPNHYSDNLPDDYDQAIKEFVSSRVNATVEKYYPCGLDGGNMFNWIHPLTRFHLRVSN